MRVTPSHLLAFSAYPGRRSFVATEANLLRTNLGRLQGDTANKAYPLVHP